MPEPSTPVASASATSPKFLKRIIDGEPKAWVLTIIFVLLMLLVFVKSRASGIFAGAVALPLGALGALAAVGLRHPKAPRVARTVADLGRRIPEWLGLVLGVLFLASAGGGVLGVSNRFSEEAQRRDRCTSSRDETRTNLGRENVAGALAALEQAMQACGPEERSELDGLSAELGTKATAQTKRQAIARKAAAGQMPRLDVVARISGSPSALAIVGDAAYVAVDVGGSLHEHDIVRVALDGSSTAVIVSKEEEDSTNFSILAAGKALFWLGVGDSNAPNWPWYVRKVPLRGGRPKTVAHITGPSEPDVATDGENLYYGEEIGGGRERIIKLPSSGGRAQRVADCDVPGARPVAVDAVNVYWATDGNSIMKASLAYGQVTKVADGLSGGVVSLASDGAYLWWSEQHGRDGAVHRVAVGGGPIKTIATGQGRVERIMLDETNAYWLRNEGDEGSQMMFARSLDGVVLPLGATQPGMAAACCMAIAGGHVYWANTGTNAILRVTKGALAASQGP